MNIASYFASIGFNVSTKDIAKVDRALNSVEKRLNDFRRRLNTSLGLDITRITLDQKKLRALIDNSLDIASARTVFQISRFDIDQTALNRAFAMSMRRAAEFASNRVKIRPEVAIPLRPQREKPIVGQHALAPQRERTRAYAGLGGIGMGLFGPVGYSALALAGGGYGLSALNQRNQEVVSAQLQAQAVVQQAGGTVEQGQQSFQWLRQQGDRIGFNYLDASPDYNKLLSGLTGAGMSIEQGQGVYKGFAELSRVNKLDRVQQQRVFRALSQIAGKNKLQSEELTGQLAESLPGAVSLFARAYQAQIGGTKTGQEAITQLLDAMKKGQVKGDILTYAGTLASQQAAPSLAAAGQASQAEQARYQNRVSDLAVLASDSGVEEGFARIFRTLNAGLGESNDLVRGLAEGFNNVTKWADDLLLWPQSFVRALEGRDSLVGDWLGMDKLDQLKKDWGDIQNIWNQITQVKAEDIFGDFLPNLKSTSEELQAILNVIAEIKRLKDGILPNTRIEADQVEKIKPFDFLPEYTSPWGLLKAGVNNMLVSVGEYDSNKQRALDREKAITDINSLYYNDAEGYDAMQRDAEQAGQKETPAPNLSMYRPQSKEERQDFENQQRIAAIQDAQILNEYKTNNEISIQLNIDPITLAQMDIEAQARQLTDVISLNLQQASVFFPVKE